MGKPVDTAHEKSFKPFWIIKIEFTVLVDSRFMFLISFWNFRVNMPVDSDHEKSFQMGARERLATSVVQVIFKIFKIDKRFW